MTFYDILLPFLAEATENIEILAMLQGGFIFPVPSLFIVREP